MPAIVRGPGVPAGQRIEAMVLNSDFAPTFAEIAGIDAPTFVDGRSFLPLFDNPKQAWRESFLIERRQFEKQYVELAERLGMAADEVERSAQFDAIRTAAWTYVEYGTGERELYDLARDPHQLDNVVESAEPALVAALRRVLPSCAPATARSAAGWRIWRRWRTPRRNWLRSRSNRATRVRAGSAASPLGIGRGGGACAAPAPAGPIISRWLLRH